MNKSINTQIKTNIPINNTVNTKQNFKTNLLSNHPITQNIAVNTNKLNVKPNTRNITSINNKKLNTNNKNKNKNNLTSLSNSKNTLNKLNPNNINSMTNNELETLIKNNPNLLNNLTKNNKKNENIAKLEKELFNLDKKIHNSGEKISSIMNHIGKQEKSRTDGYYVIGLNIAKMLSYLFNNTSNNKKFNNKKFNNININITKKKSNNINNYKKRFNQFGEYINVNHDKIDYFNQKILNESKTLANTINNNTSLKNIAIYGKIYNTTGKITPNGLLKMTRLLFKMKRNEKQWLKVVDLLELLYNNVGQYQNLTRDEFFDQKTPLDIELILELEEIYNTQHIFQNNTGISQDIYEYYSRK